jgi:hypothetical protein
MKMTEGKDEDINYSSEEDLELKRFVKKGKKLIWTWVIGTPVLIVCIIYGDAAQWLLAVFIVFYIVISTVNYLKSVS